MGAAAPFIGGGLSLVGGLLGADAARDAGKDQSQAAKYAADLQYKMWQEQQALQAPFREGGLAAQNRLMQLLGLQTANPYAQYTGMSRDQIRASLLPQFTSAASGATQGIAPGAYTTGSPFTRLGLANRSVALRGGAPGAAGGAPGTINEQALNAEIDKIMSGMQSYNALSSSPDFGKYARDFSMSDFQADPGYAFRMSEGLKALDRQAAARGGLISGAALKASQRYGQDMASQEYTNAFNRYQVNRSNQLNPLQSLMGAGQTAAQTLGQAGQQYAQAAGDARQNAAAASAAGRVGAVNALTGAASNFFDYYQNQQLLNKLGA